MSLGRTSEFNTSHMISYLSNKVTSWLGEDSKTVKAVQPVYARFLNYVAGNHGLAWTVNDEPLRIHPGVRRFVPRQSEPVLFNFLRNNLKPGQTVFDIGSFLGVYAVFAARWVGPSGRVILFEPTAANHPIIKAHLRFNGVEERVRLIEAAVGERPRVAEFFQYPESYMNKIPAAHDDPAEALVTQVSVITLDEICTELKLIPDWIRMDVQGLEFDVLRGSREVIKAGRGRLRIIAEIHSQFWPQMGLDKTKVQNILADLGLRARALKPGGDPFVPDGHAEFEYI